ncbi:MAG: hypothetical protein H7248_06570 [Microbacteriaceae bacterium]|nr:hypothetical protein [Microbacteriaceae bacterium]
MIGIILVLAAPSLTKRIGTSPARDVGFTAVARDVGFTAVAPDAAVEKVTAH